MNILMINKSFLPVCQLKFSWRYMLIIRDTGPGHFISNSICQDEVFHGSRAT